MIYTCLSEVAEHRTEIRGWVAAEVWDVVVALEDDAKLCLKERHRALKRKVQQRKKKETHRSG